MYKYLDKIKKPDDIKAFDDRQLRELCAEIRDYLVTSVARQGGHLASNLGAVELTVALHRVLDAPHDKLVWDVGHQAYVHKILTGRAERMKTLRSFGGLSGFCSPSESEYDTCVTGHASASLSAALGMAQARKISGDNYNVAAVIGDGAFTGGLAFEALNNIGNLKTKMLIVLNDNKMSITENVGAFSNLLARARTNRKYTASKQKVADFLGDLPMGGKQLYGILHAAKLRLKNMITPNVLFEQLGITYLGPVNGHNIRDMEDIFRRALLLDEPVVVHVITKKGKGYRPAEQLPQVFHGVGPFEKNTGEVKKTQHSFSSVFGEKLCRLAETDERVAAVTPAMISGSGLTAFGKRFPDRLYDVGIAEGHAVTFSAGLAAGGAVPVCAIYSSFLQRAYDNIIHDAAIGKAHVVFAVDRAGIVPGDGATHQGIFDISFLTAIPNMTVLAPSCFSELRKMLDYAVNVHNAPIAIRYPRGPERVSLDNGDFVLSRAARVRRGSDIAIAAEGQSVAKALAAAKLLSEKGISAEVIDVRTVKPMDFETVFESAQKCGVLLSIEENLKRGGMGEMLAAYAEENSVDIKMKIKAFDDIFLTHGSIGALEQEYGFTAESIAAAAERMLKN